MSFQAYLDNIEAKTGKTPKDFIALARAKGLLEPGIKTGQIVTWLKEDFGLGHGHAMAIVLVLQRANGKTASKNEKIEKLFGGNKSNWRKPYERLLDETRKFGDEVKTAPTDTYISLLKAKKKFAVIGVTAERMDIGIKLKGVQPSGRLEASGSWNAMVTHRVRISDPKQIDGQILTWLKRAYDSA